MTVDKDGSLNRSLVIDQVPVPGGGVVGLAHCPGRNHIDGHGRRWSRDLAADLAAIRAWGAVMMISLIEAKEFTSLGVEKLGEAARAAGLDWHHLPIQDMHPPDAAFEGAWRGTTAALDRLFADQGRLLLHCAGGLGRAGTIAARILIERGIPAAAAIETVRAARPGAIETAAQEAFLAGL